MGWTGKAEQWKGLGHGHTGLAPALTVTMIGQWHNSWQHPSQPLPNQCQCPGPQWVGATIFPLTLLSCAGLRSSTAERPWEEPGSSLPFAWKGKLSPGGLGDLNSHLLAFPARFTGLALPGISGFSLLFSSSPWPWGGARGFALGVGATHSELMEHDPHHLSTVPAGICSAFCPTVMVIVTWCPHCPVLQ